MPLPRPQGWFPRVWEPLTAPRSKGPDQSPGRVPLVSENQTQPFLSPLTASDGCLPLNPTGGSWEARRWPRAGEQEAKETCTSSSGGSVLGGWVGSRKGRRTFRETGRPAQGYNPSSKCGSSPRPSTPCDKQPQASYHLCMHQFVICAVGRE